METNFQPMNGNKPLPLNSILTVFKGFTREQLEQAFDLVANKEHWKNPINSHCRVDEVPLVDAAIVFFTATPASFEYQGELMGDMGRFKKGDYILKVTAKGYRLGPAGDH